MNMEPLERQAMLQSMMQQQPPQASVSPLTSGSVAAMDNIKRAMALDNEQRRNSLGSAIQHFSANMGRPENHKGGVLGAAAASMAPALNAYQQANQNGQSENMQAFEIMQALEKQAEEKRRHAMDEKHGAAQLAETQRYHDLMYKEADLSEFTKKQESGLIPTDAVPYSIMGKKEQGEVAKEQRMRLENIKNANSVLRDTKEIVKISNEYPDLSTDYNRLLINVGTGRNPTAKDIAALGIANQKKRAALEKFVKLRNELLSNKVQLAGGKVSTDIFKKTLGDTLADPSSSNETINYIGKYTEEKLSPLISEEDDIRKAISGRYFVPQRINTKNGSVSNAQPASEQNEAQQQTSAVSEIMPTSSPREAAREKMIAGGIKDENVIEAALKARGL